MLTEKGSVGGPLLFWERENKRFVFTCSPLDSNQANDKIFCCQLTILSKSADLNKEFNLIEKTENEKNKIFEQVDNIVKNIDDK